MENPQNNLFKELDTNYEILKERLFSDKLENIFKDYERTLLQINQKEKKLNECFCKNCLDDYLNLSYNVSFVFLIVLAFNNGIL